MTGSDVGPLSARPAAPTESAAAGPPWTVLLVDPDPAARSAAAAALAGFQFDGRPLDLALADSAASAYGALRSQRAIAALILEPALETPQAGLELVEHIRGELDNQRIRIIILTGQPDAAPEEALTAQHDISDYRLKAATGPVQLRTALTSALRSAAVIQALAARRAEQARFLMATGGMIRLRSPQQFYGDVLPRLMALPGVRRDALMLTFDSQQPEQPFQLRAGSGRFADFATAPLPPEVGERVAAALKSLNAASDSDTVVSADHCTLRLRTHGGVTGVIYVEGRFNTTSFEWQLLEVFRNKAAIAFESMLLVEELNAAQQASVIALATLAEYKDYGSTGHLQRIEKMTMAIAGELLRRRAFPYEVDEEFVEKIGLASILHDVGMICVPDEILTIPGELVEEDLKLVYRHAEVGYRVLAEAAEPLRGRSFLALGAEIARNHHERYDGSGYPDGLRGADIPLAARIAAVADVFDALISDRHYRDAWPLEEAVLWVRERAGTDFDPAVVDAFAAVIEPLRRQEPALFAAARPQAAAETEEAREGWSLPGLFRRLVTGR